MFDPVQYDSWYERHSAFYRAELAALRPLCEKFESPGLEVGVGTGRFAAELGFEYGIDPDVRLLELAKKRGVRVREGVGENLPYPDEWFGKVLVVTAFPFFEDVHRVVAEIWRVLRVGGGLVVGMVPRDSYFGRRYANIRFYSVDELIKIISPKFRMLEMRSTLIGTPPATTIKQGAVKGAGFVAMAWIKTGKKF